MLVPLSMPAQGGEELQSFGARPLLPRQGVAGHLNDIPPGRRHQFGNTDPLAARRGNSPACDDQSVGPITQRRVGIGEAECDQLLARGERGRVDGRGHQIGKLRSAGDRGAGQAGVPELCRHLFDRHAKRISGRLRKDRVRARSHVDRTRQHLDRAVGQDPHDRLTRARIDRMGPAGHAPADQLAALPHRPRHRVRAVPSRTPPLPPHRPPAGVATTRACRFRDPHPAHCAGATPRDRCPSATASSSIADSRAKALGFFPGARKAPGVTVFTGTTRWRERKFGTAYIMR